MTIDETKKIMEVIKIAFPDFYKGADTEEKKAALKLWSLKLSKYSYQQCNDAVMKLIDEFKYSSPNLGDLVRCVTPDNALPEKSTGTADWLTAWYEKHVRDLHSRGLKTAGEIKTEQTVYAKEHGIKMENLTSDEWYKLGLSHRNYCDQI